MTRKTARRAGESVSSMSRTEYRTPARLSCVARGAWRARGRSKPDGRLPGPLAVGVGLRQFVGGRLERRWVVRRLVGRDTGPVAGLGRGAALAVRFADDPEALAG